MQINRDFLPSYAFAIVILIVSSLPGSELEKIQKMPDSMVLRFLLSDPAMHLAVFALFSGLLCYGFYRSGINPIPIMKVIIAGFAYVLFIEIYQAILPWRSFGFDDILWGNIGVVSAPILVRLISRN